MKKILLAALAFFFCSTSIQAQFFGGYADGETSVPTHYNTIGGLVKKMVYDDFRFDLAGDIVGFEMIGNNFTGSPVGMYYEIRTDMNDGDGGTLLYSGYNLSAVMGFLPVGSAFGTPPAGPTGYGYGWYDSGPASTIHLDPGTYWIGMAAFEGFGSFNVTSTHGLNGVGHPLDDGDAWYYDSTAPDPQFVSMGDLDFGLRIFTAQNTITESDPEGMVPEASALVWLPVGLLPFLRRRKNAA